MLISFKKQKFFRKTIKKNINLLFITEIQYKFTSKPKNKNYKSRMVFK